MKKEDDRGFIIKCHALFKALLSQLLVKILKKPELKTDLYHLPMNGKASKISFLLALSAFEEEHKNEIKQFIQNFSELRNNLVHHAENLTFNLQAYVKGI